MPTGAQSRFSLARADGVRAFPRLYALRVTTVFRREDGEWKVVHRHGDSPPDDVSARVQIDRLSDERRDR